ncbi:DNA polymerase eta, putative [Leishmania tarentolae]|uniref:DNA polymerase eta, putative n=1 Tax=Leishmania tarentolae TaxID=5689 RepID=A0A640KG69_LEITA|nr:DNA polymerase eta, putative [Leishmania tarentolae]
MQPDILAAVAMREVQAAFRSKPDAAADSVTLTIGSFVSDGSSAISSVPPFVATPGHSTDAGQDTAARGHLRQQTLLSSFLATSAAGRGAPSALQQRSSGNVAEVLSSNGSWRDNSDSNDSVHIEGDAVILSISSQSLSSNSGDMSSVLLIDRTPPFSKRDAMPETRCVTKAWTLDMCESSPCEAATASESSQAPLLSPPLPVGKLETEECPGESHGVTRHHGHQRRLGVHLSVVPQLPPSSPAPASAVEVIEDNGGVEGEDGVTIID